ncbi:MAG: hypothetical protein WC273_10015 [Dehalococcoidia bacterium]
MTQGRSRALGRAIMAWSGVQVLLAALRVRRWPLPLALIVIVGAAALSAFCAWVGYTLATTNWDNPADYPPSEDAAPDAAS